jgi:hypothetical protein
VNDSAIRGKLDTFLVAISLGWLLLWGLVCAALGDWLPMELSLLTIPVMVLGAIVFVISVARLFVLLIGKRVAPRALSAVAILIGAYPLGSVLPSRPAVAFYLHQDEFVDMAQEAQADYSNDGGFEFPAGSLYRDAIVYTDFISGATVIEFMIGDFYLPLVYVSTGRAEDVYDTCSAGGLPIEELAPNWYVCRRDWN